MNLQLKEHLEAKPLPEGAGSIFSYGRGKAKNKTRMSAADLKVLLSILITAGIILCGCASRLPDGEVKYIISKHFALRGYSVSELELGDITPPALSETGYMGTKSYRISVKHISLTPKGGHPVVFKDATVFIKEDLDRHGNFLVSQVIGIPVP